MNIQLAAERIVQKLIQDFDDRRALRQGWEQLDAAHKDQIRTTWQFIVERELQMAKDNSGV